MDKAKKELEEFEKANSVILDKYTLLKNSVLFATEKYKKDLLESHKYLIGKTCFIPSGQECLIDKIRLSNKSMKIICDVNVWNNYNESYDKKEFPIDDLKINI